MRKFKDIDSMVFDAVQNMTPEEAETMVIESLNDEDTEHLLSECFWKLISWAKYSYFHYDIFGGLMVELTTEKKPEGEKHYSPTFMCLYSGELEIVGEGEYLYYEFSK